MSEKISIGISKENFGVIRASLIQSQKYWENALSAGEFPEGFNPESIGEIIRMLGEVREKVEIILTMNPIDPNVGVTR